MDAKWVRPEGVGALRVADRDVAGESFDVAGARPVSEGGGHVVELPFAFGGVGGEGGNACAVVGVSFGGC